jgi:hypothetical protein
MTLVGRSRGTCGNAMCFRGTRIPVCLVLQKFAAGTHETLLKSLCQNYAWSMPVKPEDFLNASFLCLAENHDIWDEL